MCFPLLQNLKRSCGQFEIFSLSKPRSCPNNMCVCVFAFLHFTRDCLSTCFSALSLDSTNLQPVVQQRGTGSCHHMAMMSHRSSGRHGTHAVLCLSVLQPPHSFTVGICHLYLYLFQSKALNDGRLTFTGVAPSSTFHLMPLLSFSYKWLLH